MEKLFEKFQRKTEAVPLQFVRSIMTDIAWEARLIGVRGARGVGKTTLMLQYIKLNLKLDGTVLYVSLDDIWFSSNKLVDLAENFVKKGGKHLFIDEVHKYPHWAQEIKNIYDDYPELQVVFTGSSLLEILNARADISRRAVMYTMYGLSYREYLNMTLNTTFTVIGFVEILQNHVQLAQSINRTIKPLQHWDDYLKSGYYPFFKEAPSLYHQRIEEVINFILDVELPLLRKVDLAYVRKLKQLLQIIANSVPFIPNISKLSERIGINRNTLISYLYFMQEAHLTHNIYKDAFGISRLQKPDKIYLENTNLQYTLSPENTNMGNIRETFFLMQVTPRHTVEFISEGDFKVDGTYIIEVGGAGKTDKQIRNYDNAFVAADNLEYGIHNKIPLWIFGFLY